MSAEVTSDWPHRRKNLLTGEWVLVSPHRAKRPWQGEQSAAEIVERPAYDAACYLCPGNTRTGGEVNPDYALPFTFRNDFPALLETSECPAPAAPFEAESARGEAHVICYSGDHSKSMATLSDDARQEVVNTWCEISARLGGQYAHVQIFENSGAMMGASSPHPHGQVWASDFVPEQVAKEDARQREYFAAHGRALLDDVAAAEIADGSRVIAENEDWLCTVPYWAAWPFETLLMAKGGAARLEDLAEKERASLARILGEITRRYDALFGCSFPYSFGWHGAPHGNGHGNGADTKHSRLHAHFYPPLLRSSTVRKHMVGFELLAEIQRDLTPEAAAQRLREVMA